MPESSKSSYSSSELNDRVRVRGRERLRRRSRESGVDRLFLRRRRLVFRLLPTGRFGVYGGRDGGGGFLLCVHQLAAEVFQRVERVRDLAVRLLYALGELDRGSILGFHVQRSRAVIRQHPLRRL